MSTMNKSYLELINLSSFEERFQYLKLDGYVGSITFGGRRYLNQILYQSSEWKKVKREIIIRDNGCDLAHPDFEIVGVSIYVHHINPITVEDILERKSCVFNPNNLISCSFSTHNAIHYGDANYAKQRVYVERKPNDTCPWRL